MRKDQYKTEYWVKAPTPVKDGFITFLIGLAVVIAGIIFVALLVLPWWSLVDGILTNKEALIRYGDEYILHSMGASWPVYLSIANYEMYIKIQLEMAFGIIGIGFEILLLIFTVFYITEM